MKLTYDDLTRLTRYKWRYMLQQYGFSKSEAEYLVFTRWRVASDGYQLRNRVGVYGLPSMDIPKWLQVKFNTMVDRLITEMIYTQDADEIYGQ